MKLLGRPPKAGDEVGQDGFSFHVEEGRGSQVQRVRVRYEEPRDEDEGDEP